MKRVTEIVIQNHMAARNKTAADTIALRESECNRQQPSTHTHTHTHTRRVAHINKAQWLPMGNKERGYSVDLVHGECTDWLTKQTNSTPAHAHLSSPTFLSSCFIQLGTCITSRQILCAQTWPQVPSSWLLAIQLHSNTWKTCVPSAAQPDPLLHSHAHAHTCTHMHTHAHTCTHIHTRTHARTHTRTHTRTHAHTHCCRRYQRVTNAA